MAHRLLGAPSIFPETGLFCYATTVPTFKARDLMAKGRSIHAVISSKAMQGTQESKET